MLERGNLVDLAQRFKRACFFFRGISKPDERACSADKRFFKTDARTKHTHTPYIHTHKDKDKDRPKAKIYRQPIAKKKQGWGRPKMRK